MMPSASTSPPLPPPGVPLERRRAAVPRLARGAAALALAATLAASALASGDGTVRVVAGGAAGGIVLLLWAIVRARRSIVAPAAGLMALAMTGGNGGTFTAVPAQTAGLVAMALLAWWSIDERRPVAAPRSADAGRWLTSAALVVAAATSAALVLAMPSVASAGVVAPVVGAVGVVSISAVLWALVRLQRHGEDGPL